jgi:polyhydroxybutyrate depolymerase
MIFHSMRLPRLLFVAALASACGSSSSSSAPQQNADSALSMVTCSDPAPAGNDPCTGVLVPGTDVKCTFDYKGRSRSYLVYAPRNYDRCAATPLVMDAHGHGETAENHAGLTAFSAGTYTWPIGLGSGWRLVADREKLIVVMPQGTSNTWVEADADFIFDVEARVAKTAKIDEKRVFMTGISQGGILTYWVACRDTGVFRAFAPVSGASERPSCPRATPLPLVAFNAKGDAIIPYSDGEAAVTAWAAGNHCKTGPTASLTYAGPMATPDVVCLSSGPHDTPPWSLVACNSADPASTCQTWSECDGGTKVNFCTVNGASQPAGGHVLYWNDTHLSIAAATWDFWKQF